jgi:DUF971 family protein
MSTPRRGGFSPDQMTPTDLKLKRAEQKLFVTWRDGRQSVYTAVKLRKNCPCATCRTERQQQSTELLPVLKQAPARDLRIDSIELVGRYAIQLRWSDGHSTGIYDFEYLRALDG